MLKRLLIVIGCIAVLSCYGFFYLVSSIESGADAFQRDSLINEIVNQHIAIPMRVNDIMRPAIFGGVAVHGILATRYIKITIYGVKNISDQKKIIDTIAEYRQRNQLSKPIEIDFYDAENWIETPKGRKRGAEQLNNICYVPQTTSCIKFTPIP